ncbi:hypothetical protein [Qipengyuania oceanensis]|uniref:Uncharacterized protein n=1 Tax=Qipengyuania oceanensis TaxID=1463597 RepID=A0A844YHY1_9SPHN|nr:hypothetical protein [Qipengyuania oceanensis]MXO63741.1 hypothetical protein [Qipengyuania oceanensis]
MKPEYSEEPSAKARAVLSPGPSEGPYRHEIRIALTSAQKSYLEQAAGCDAISAFVRDKLFYASPNMVTAIGAIGALYQAAGQVIEASDELRMQAAKAGRTIDSIGQIAISKNEVWEGMPKDIATALRPVGEQAERLHDLGTRLHGLANNLAAEDFLGAPNRKLNHEIQPRPRPKP